MAKFFNNFRPTSQDLDDYQRIIEIFKWRKVHRKFKKDEKKWIW